MLTRSTSTWLLILTGIFGFVVPDGFCASCPAASAGLSAIVTGGAMRYDGRSQHSFAYDGLSSLHFQYGDTSVPSIGEVGPWTCSDCTTSLSFSKFLAAESEGQFVFRELSATDRARLDQGLGLISKGTGGTIADQVRGLPTKYISASETIAGTADYAGGNGLVAIDVKAAIEGGAGYVPHDNVMQTLLRTETGLPLRNASNAREVMFKGEIPFNAIRPLKGE